MKVFFDTNVYVAEALLGGAAAQMIGLRWRVFASEYVLDEIRRVLTQKLRFSRRFGRLTCERVRRRVVLIEPPASHHEVFRDPTDNPILHAAVAAGTDFLVTNDKHLLELNPYQGLRIISMTEYFSLLVDEGHIVA